MTYQTDAKLPAPNGVPSERYQKHLEARRKAAAIPQRVTITEPKRAQKPRAGTVRRNKVPTIRGFPVTPIVYFVQAKTMGLIKIGSTVDLNDRLKTLQVGSPDKLEVIGAISSTDAFDIEERLHGRFDALRSHGEWFRPGEALLALIAEWPIERMERQQLDELAGGMRKAYSGKPATG